jgi:hypothetical protein
MQPGDDVRLDQRALDELTGIDAVDGGAYDCV